jgi:hypothetical protein
VNFHLGLHARRAAAISFFRTHSVLASPDSRIAFSISAYSGGDNRVEMNLPRFSFSGSTGLPTFGVSLIIEISMKKPAKDILKPASHPDEK